MRFHIFEVSGCCSTFSQPNKSLQNVYFVEKYFIALHALSNSPIKNVLRRMKQNRFKVVYFLGCGYILTHFLKLFLYYIKLIFLKNSNPQS